MEKKTPASDIAPAEDIPKNVEEKRIDGDDDGDDESLPFQMHEAERFITFTDAVVAIAMTLLILPLMDAATDLGDELLDKDASVSGYIKENESKIIGFAVSFFIVAYLWILGDTLTRYVGCFTPRMLWLNFLWMFGIVCIPVGTSIYVNCDDEDANAVIVYVAPMLLSASASFLMCVIMRNDKRTLKGHKGPGVLLLIELGVVVCLLVIGLVIVCFIPSLDSYVMLIISLAHPIRKAIRHMHPSLDHEEYVK